MANDAVKSTFTKSVGDKLVRVFLGSTTSKSESKRGENATDPRLANTLSSVSSRLKGKRTVVAKLWTEENVGAYLAELLALTLPTAARDRGGNTVTLTSAGEFLRRPVLVLGKNISLPSDDDEANAIWAAYCDLFGVQSDRILHKLSMEQLIWASGLCGVAKVAKQLEGFEASPEALTLLTFVGSIMSYVEPLFLLNYVEGM